MKRIADVQQNGPEAEHDVVELVERCVLTLVDPAMLSNLTAYAAAAQSGSTQQNVATARNINAPNSTTFVNSSSG
jgi:hypothetical protein